MNKMALSSVVLALACLPSCRPRVKSESKLHLSKSQDLPREDAYSSVIGSLYNARGDDFCTATLINSCNLITAAHCAKNLFLDGFRTNRGVKSEIGQDMVSVVRAESAEQNSPSRNPGETDIAIIRLTRSLSPEVQFEIPDSALLQPGEELTVFGASPISRLAAGADVQKGIGVFHRYKISAGSDFRKDDLDTSTVGLEDVETTSLVLRGIDDPSKGSMICGGDSGGPTFDKNNKLVGVHQGSASITTVYLCYFPGKAAKTNAEGIAQQGANFCDPGKQIEARQFSVNYSTHTGCVDRRAGVPEADQDKIWKLVSSASFCAKYGRLASFEDLKRMAADSDFRSALVPGQKSGPGVYMLTAEKHPQGEVVFSAASSATGEVFSRVDDQFLCGRTVESYDSSVSHYKGAIAKILGSAKHRCPDVSTERK